MLSVCFLCSVECEYFACVCVSVLRDFFVSVACFFICPGPFTFFGDSKLWRYNDFDDNEPDSFDIMICCSMVLIMAMR